MRRRGVPRQSGRATLVMMVKSTDIGKLDDLTQFWRLDWSGLWTVHLQRAANPPPMVVVEVACKESLDVALIEDNDMVNAFAADGPDEALYVWRLPRGAWCNRGLLEPEAVHSGPEPAAV